MHFIYELAIPLSLITHKLVRIGEISVKARGLKNK